MFKKIFILFSFFFFFNSLNAQFIPKRWSEVYIDSARTVYLDTTSIRNREKQYIFWALEVLKNPMSVERIPEKIYRTKSQYVVNGITDKFNMIGVLYYDKKGKLVGENYARGLTGSGDVFSKPVEENPLVALLTNKVEEYLNSKLEKTGVKPEDSTTSEYIARLRSLLKNDGDLLNSQNTDEKKAQPKSNSDSLASLIDKKKETVSVLPLPGKEKSDKRANYRKKEKYKDVINLKKNSDKEELEKKKPIDSKIPLKKYKYDSESERSVSKTIFTDGEKYIVQISSWKNRKIAENQRNILLKLGYNAFITQVYIKRKRGTWNRVRVGYFDTVREARKIQKEIKRKLK